MGSKQKDGIQLERSFLLRLPEPQAEMVRKTLHAGFVKDYLSIEFQADNRHATVRVGKSCLTGKLMDLPSIVESFKTVDKKSFYKTADVCQMLVCTAENDDVDVEETSEQTAPKKDKKFMFNHGVTPPLKNVRKRRFRKTARKKHQECPEVEKELKRLLRADVQAENVTFEVLADEEKNEERPSLMSSPLANNHHGDEVDHLAFLQEPMSDEDDELDVENIQKDKLSSHSQFSGAAVQRSPNTSLFKEEEKTHSINKTSQSLSSDVLDVCEELRQKIEAQKARIENAENPFLKQRFQSTLEKLQQQLKEKETED